MSSTPSANSSAKNPTAHIAVDHPQVQIRTVDLKLKHLRQMDRLHSITQAEFERAEILGRISGELLKWDRDALLIRLEGEYKILFIGSDNVLLKHRKLILD